MAHQSYYAKHPETNRKVRVPSVTGVLKYVGDKGALMGWYFQQGKEAMRLEIEEDAGPFNKVWDLPKTDAEIGTIVHAMIEADVTGVDYDSSHVSVNMLEPAREAFKQWARYRDDRKIEKISTECPLVSQEHGYGGTCDLVARIDGRTTLVDYKTGGIYADHIAQIAAYANLWEENYPDEPLEALALLAISKSHGLFRWISLERNADMVKRGWELFKAGLIACREEKIISKGLK